MAGAARCSKFVALQRERLIVRVKANLLQARMGFTVSSAVPSSKHHAFYSSECPATYLQRWPWHWAQLPDVSTHQLAAYLQVNVIKKGVAGPLVNPRMLGNPQKWLSEAHNGYDS